MIIYFVVVVVVVNYVTSSPSFKHGHRLLLQHFENMNIYVTTACIPILILYFLCIRG